MKKYLIIVFVILFIGIAFVVLLNHKKISQKSDKIELHKLADDEHAKDIKAIDKFFEQLYGNYTLGSEKMDEGSSETKLQYNKNHDLLEVHLSDKVYLAKHYFEEMLLELGKIEAGTDEVSEIKRIFEGAAKNRIDAVDFFVKGLLLKEKIGKTMQANIMGSINGGVKLLPIPSYDGSLEESYAKVKISDKYMLEGFKKLKKLEKKFPNNKNIQSLREDLLDN